MTVFTNFLVLGHHHRRIIMVILKAAVSPILQEQPYCINLISSTSTVKGCVSAV